MLNQQQDLRTRLRFALRNRGLLGPVQRLRRGASYTYQLLSAAKLRRQIRDKREFRQFSLRYGEVLGAPYIVSPGAQVALFLGPNRAASDDGRSIASRFPGPLRMIKVLQMAGYRPAVLLPEDEAVRPYYELAGVKDIHFWNPTAGASRFVDQAREILMKCQSQQDVFDLEFEGVRVGRAALSTTIRYAQTGSVVINPVSLDQDLVMRLAHSMATTVEASRILGQLNPSLTLSFEMEYTPKREVFDLTLARGGQVVAYCRGHKSDALMLRRFSAANRTQHPSSLSDASWQEVKQMPWCNDRSAELFAEYQQCYANGDWMATPSAHVNRQGTGTEEIRRRLGLDPTKKNAFIFPHVPWDSSACWGVDLFQDYQEWLVQTVRAACDNPRVNWVVKIHPANVTMSRSLLDGKDPLEVSVIRQHIGRLPPHVVLIPADSDISTIELYDLMDYCLTVRGTVGIEAAIKGIPVLTGGTGRYNHKGFTIDSSSTADYLDRVRRIQEIPRLTNNERELAERYAYGMFLLRPLLLETVPLQSTSTRDNGARWYTDDSLRVLANWLSKSDADDFMHPLPVGDSMTCVS